ncbi:MAG: CHASE4 domain-containing protein, partial [Spirochaetota bacterium]
IRTSRGIMLVSSYPVLDSRSKFPPNGRIISGRFFGSDQVESIRELFKINVSLETVKNSSGQGQIPDIPFPKERRRFLQLTATIFTAISFWMMFLEIPPQSFY